MSGVASVEPDLVAAPLVFILGCSVVKSLPLGSATAKNGDIVVIRDPFTVEVPVRDSDEMLRSTPVGLRGLAFTVLLLRTICFSGSRSVRPREKNELLDAVIGVVGVLGMILWGGGLSFPSSSAGRAAIFDVVGVLRGPRFNGGKLRGANDDFFW